MKYKKFFCCFFVALLFVPLILQTAGEALDKRLDVSVDNETAAEKPPFRLAAFADGSYQESYNSWIQKNYGGRNAVVKTYNQLRFSLLGEADHVIGRNKNIFQQIYVDEYLTLQEKYDFSREENQERLTAYLDKLELLTQLLEREGKVLIFVTTPTKCDFYADRLPGVYRNRRREGRRGIDLLREAMEGRDIRYIDTGLMAAGESGDYPLFYETGIHWSRPLEQKVSLAVLEEIERATGWKVNSFSLGELKTSSVPHWRDDDIWRLLNLWEKPEGEYYIYDTEQIRPENNVPLNFLIQGGSFSLGFREDYYHSQTYETLDYIFYNQHVFGIDGSLSYLSPENDPDAVVSDWSGLDVQTLIEDKNVFIIEVNEEHIFAFNNGFVDFLWEYFADGGKDPTVPLTNLELTGDYGEQSGWLTGVYPYEQDEQGAFAWSEGDMTVQLVNPAIASKGLEAVFEVPEQLLGAGEAEVGVYVNGQPVETARYGDAGLKSIVVEPGLIGGAEGDKYSVEIKCPAYFRPSELGANQDDRKLSLKIRYVGELR